MKRVLFIMFAACTLAAVVHAKEGGRHSRLPRGPWMEEAPELPKEKLKAIREVMERSRKDASGLHDRLKVAMSKLQWQVDAKADAKELSSTLGEVRKAREAMRSHFEKARAEVDGLLTPEQQARMLLSHRRPGPESSFDPMGMGHKRMRMFGPGPMRGSFRGRRARPAPGDDDEEAGPDDQEDEE